MLNHFSHFFLPSYRNRLLQLPEADEAQRVAEVKGWSAETTEVKYNDYVLLVLIFDLFIDLFVPFAAVCPTSVQRSLDSTMLLSVAMSNDRWTQSWTYGGEWAAKRAFCVITLYALEIKALFFKARFVANLDDYKCVACCKRFYSCGETIKKHEVSFFCPTL